ncbi:hypothetical protein NDU88_004632 [Pleurodeles waltl]|uniref:Uncharacterized protein n=1 Tax=Pleurodeles waltl TaxID=8319 RepID=A0AAV7LJ71_PLEWA|nr:hypothetical protein NDU88_004632 [Pleurodeles waltl]
MCWDARLNPRQPDLFLDISLVFNEAISTHEIPGIEGLFVPSFTTFHTTHVLYEGTYLMTLEGVETTRCTKSTGFTHLCVTTRISGSGVPDRPHKVPDVTYKKKGTHIAASGIRYGRSLVIFPELVRILW